MAGRPSCMVADRAGSALTATAARSQLLPGHPGLVQPVDRARPDAADRAGVPTRLMFGLEEVWQNEEPARRRRRRADRSFKVVGRYFAGNTCQFLNARATVCPTTASDPASTTRRRTPTSTRRSSSRARRRRRRSWSATTAAPTRRRSAPGEEFDHDGWGRGANHGFNTLLPYDAQIAKDGTIWAGLQDNGEMKIEPDGKQLMTFGGDGASAPSTRTTATSPTRRRRSTRSPRRPTAGRPGTTSRRPRHLPVHQPVRDGPDGRQPPDDRRQQGPRDDRTARASWKTVFDLGTRTQPGDPAAAGEAGDPDNVVSAIDVRGVGAAAARRRAADARTSPSRAAGSGPAWHRTAASTRPAPTSTSRSRSRRTRPTARRRSPSRGTTAAIDWDLFVFRKEGAELVEVAGSSGQGAADRRASRSCSRAPRRASTSSASQLRREGTFRGEATFEPAARATPPPAAARPTSASAATATRSTDSRSPTASPPTSAATARSASPARPTTGTSRARAGCPSATSPRSRSTRRPAHGLRDARRLQPPLAAAGRARRGGRRRRRRPRLQVHRRRRDVHRHLRQPAGHPGELVARAQRPAVVATDLGVFISADTSGGTYELLGDGPAAAPVFSLELKPKATPPNPTADRRDAGPRRLPLPVRRSGQSRPRPAPSGCPAADDAGGAGPHRRLHAGDAGARARRRRRPVACTASRALSSASAPAPGAGCGSASRARSRGRSPSTCSSVSRARACSASGWSRASPARSRGFTWNGRANRRGRTVGDGYYFVRYTLRDASGVADMRRLVLRRSAGAGRAARRTTAARAADAGARSSSSGRCSAGPAARAGHLRSGSTHRGARHGDGPPRRPRRQALPGRAADRRTGPPARCRRAGCARGDYRVTIEVRRGQRTDRRHAHVEAAVAPRASASPARR